MAFACLDSELQKACFGQKVTHMPSNFFLVSSKSLFSKKISVEKSDALQTYLDSVGNPLFFIQS